MEQYAKDKGFMIAHHPKDYFTLEKNKEFFPDELYQEKVKSPRRGTIGCSSKSHGRVKNCECTFRIMYHWDTRKKMSAIKANGKLSLMLSNGTYSTAQTRIQQVTRDQDIAALEEMKYCRINLMKTRKKYAAQFLLTKASALKYQVVKQVSPLCTTQWTVKERE
jgi:hypothetical protein